MLFRDDKELKSKDEWSKGCQVMLHEALEALKDKDSTSGEACKHLEKMVMMDVITRNAIEFTDTHCSQ